MTGNRTFFSLIILGFVLFSSLSYAQITTGLVVDPDKTAIELVEELLGDGFTYNDNVWGAQLIGTSIANGYFDGTQSNLGMSSGIIFSSGAATGAQMPTSPNSTSPGSGSNGGGPDPDLTAIIGNNTNDASGLIFSFRPDSDTIKFQYIFGSEEYPEYNNGPFNDVFAFFLSGPDPAGGNYIKKNIALIPGTNTEISIETVNSEDNSQYYYANEQGGPGGQVTVEYDGFTTVLTAWALVVPCEDYEIKIVIADAQDAVWDSGVFLKTNSFTAAQVEVTQEYAVEGIPNSVEGCNDVTLNFSIDERDIPTNITFVIETGAGQAEYGVDYTTLPPLDDFPNGSFLLPAHQTSTTLQIIPIDDGISEPQELFQLLYTHDLGCFDSSTDTVTVIIEDHLNIALQPFGDSQITCGDTIPLWIEATDGYPPLDYTWSNGITGVDSINVSPRENTSYTIEINDQCNFTNQHTFEVEVIQPVANILGVEEICAFDTLYLEATGGFTYLWNTGSNDTILQINPSITSDYDVTAYTYEGCVSEKAVVTVPVLPLPTVSISGLEDVCINNFQYELGNGTPEGGIYSGDGVYVSSGTYYFDASGYNNNDIAEIIYTYTDENQCTNTDSDFITVLPLPVVEFNTTDNIVCINEGAITLVGGNPSGGVYSGPGVTGSSFNPDTPETGIGEHTIKYTYTDGNGCANFKNKIYEVVDLPQITFGTFPTVCAGDAAIELNQATPEGGTYSGPGVVGNQFVPSNAGGAGTYTISYSYSSSDNCLNSADRSLTVYPEPQAPTSINTSATGYCSAEKPATITLSCTGADPDINYFWYSGNMDGSPIGNAKSIEIPAPEETTTYFVRSQTFHCGNSEDLSVVVEVSPSPVASFSVGAACLGESITPLDNSSNATISSWSWDFGDGSTSGQQAPSHTYSAYGDYTISLQVQTAFGCSDNTSQSVSVHDNPTALFSVEDNCHEQSTPFTNQSSAPVSNITSYSWNMDGQTLSSPNPVYTFSSPGTYTVSLEVGTPYGCTDTYQDQVEIFPLPNVGFNYYNPCRSNVVELTNTSTAQGSGNSLESFLWDFNNGETSTARDLTYIYDTDGTYQISLTTVDSRGCEDTYTSDNVIVSPDFDVSINSNDFCIGVSGLLDGGPVPADLPLDSYKWILPNGNTATGEDVSYTFNAAGDYDVLLVGTLGECTAGRSSTINVRELPTPAFNISGYCVNSPSHFTDQSSADGLGIISREWDLGNGEQYSDVTSVSTTYTSTGSYPVSLSVTDSRGCENTTIENLVLNPLPTAAFAPQLPYCVGDEIAFSNQSYSVGGFSGFQWNMGDGTTYTDVNPSHTFAGDGNQQVQLIAIDEWLCRDTTNKTIFVTPDFSIDFTVGSICNGFPATLTGEVVAPPLTPDSWSWSFADGGTASGQVTSYTFAQSGSQGVTLTARKNGCPEVMNKEILVNPCPTANFIYSLVSLDDTVQFQDVSTLNGGPAIISWEWEFGDPMSGLDNYSSQQNPKHLFSHLGDFDVSLTVTDLNGCSNTVVKTLTVNPRPVAGFSWDISCFGENVQFTDTSYTSQGFITDWWWNFGDPASGAFNSSTAQNPTHAFTAPGTYDVQLVVKAYGYDTIVQQVEVYPAPVADYSFNTPCLGEAVNFIDESLEGAAPIESWYWDFADGSFSTDQNPSHVYDFSGNYLVDLTVTDTNGCSHTVTQNVTIWQGAIAKFNYYSACEGSPTYFVDKSILDGVEIVSWDWSFGDPASGTDNYSTLQNPSHEFTTLGTFEVILLVEDANGCTDSDTVMVTIEPAPVVDFTAANVCKGETMYFNNTSYSNGQPIISWYWEFGDGTTTTVANPSHTYAAAGTYDVLLVVETGGGCVREIVKSVEVYYLPTSDFQWEGNQACFGDSIRFMDLSYPTGSALIDTWNWQFGDGATSTEQNPKHYYDNFGDYPVSLQVIDVNGCESSSTQTLSVSAPPISSFTYENNNCDTIAFTSTSYAPNGGTITEYYWNFDDPASGVNNTSTLANPIHNFLNEGSYLVTHVVTNESLCSDTVQIEIQISKPHADFEYTTDCAGLPVDFTDLSTSLADPIESWAWDFGDGQSSNLQNPSHIYANGGNYLVSLTITTEGGCQSLRYYTISIDYGPTADFIHTPVQCEGDPIDFTDISTSVAGISGWFWQFGDGSTSTEQNPSHIYAAQGDYLVQLQVSQANGCIGTATEMLSINGGPEAFFNWTTDNCDSTYFTDFSNNNGVNIVAWEWNFDDPATGGNNISFAQNPAHKFSQAGTYQVQLRITNASLCTDTLIREVLYNTEPQPDFTYDTVCYGDPTPFTDITSTENQSIQSWEWNFGDGGTSSAQNPTHVFGAPGTYQVSLKVINNSYCTDSISKEVYVRTLPVVAFIPDSSCINAVVNFEDMSNPVDGSIVGWQWDFGDGGTSTAQNPSHTYTEEGNFMVSLSVENSYGCSNIFSKNHYVNPLPLADFTADSVCLGNFTQFINQSYSPVGIASWEWNFGDGSTSNLVNPTHTYATAGEFTVSLNVTDELGCSGSIEKTVYVSAGPSAAFEATTACLGDTTYFTDLSAGAISWQWYFGDGSSSTAASPAHLYQNPGTYTVLLQVSDELGCSSSMEQEVIIYSLPLVNFSWDGGACPGDEVYFEDLSDAVYGEIASWSWDFGDGNSSNLSDPSHLYETAGSYTVTLVITTSNGCENSLSRQVTMNEAPMAAFSYELGGTGAPCANRAFNFFDESTTNSGIIQSWQWNFGDGQDSDLQNPIHSYALGGDYEVSLIVSNSFGCSDTMTMVVSVYDLPVVEFSFDTVCIGDSTHFNDSEFVSAGGIAQWSYSFGDGNSADISDPAHQYIAPGTYSVVLQLVDTNGCAGQKQHQVPVYAAPQPDFVFDTACLGLPTHYTDLSAPANFEITQWSWQFGDGDGDNTQNPVHVFTQDGVFNTQLVVTDSWGCRDSVQKLVNVYQPPVAYFTFSDTSCNSGEVQFTDSSYHEQFVAVTDFLWQIDGYETDEQNPLYIFPQVEQTYPVSLVVTDERGCTDTTYQDIFIEPELQISFRADTVCYGQQTMLIASALKPENAEVSMWSWYFDDGSAVLNTTADTVYHSFSGDGSFRVELTAYQKGTACSADATEYIMVRELPVADFVAEPAACADSTLFLEESIGSEGQIDQWIWYFGDGNMQVINRPDNPDIAYLYPPFLETYQASLVITNEFGCSDSTSQPVLRYPCLYVNFETDTSLYCQNTIISFTDSSIVNEQSEVLIRYWNFGDGNELTTGPDTEMVQHTYATTGEFIITYAITFDINGTAVTDTARKNIRVYPTPIAAIDAQNVCDGEEALLVSNTNANGSIVGNWTWNFGDGSDSTIISNNVNNAIRHTYAQSGQYNLSLMAVTDLGCRDTASRLFTVNPVPQIGFMADTNMLCGPGQILFTDTSNIESGSIISRSWDFGDLSSATTAYDTITHDYAFFNPEQNDNNRYTIYLSVSSDSACVATDSIRDMITMYTLPRPAFSVEPDSVAISQLGSLEVINESENAYYYEWLLADSIFYESTFEPDLSEDIQDTGRYQLQLFAQTIDGCWDSTQASFYVYPVLRFFIANAFSPNGNGVNEYFGPQGRYFDDKSYRFKIFSRWGEMVFETDDVNEKWDGKHRKTGELMAIGTYAWIIELTDLQGNNEKYSGTVTLIL